VIYHLTFNDIEGVHREKSFVFREENDAPSGNSALREEFEEQLAKFSFGEASMSRYLL
jgi:hypothetical protein